MSNPVLRESVFESYGTYNAPAVMTVEGAATKTGFLLLLAGCSAAFSWSMLLQNPAAAMPWVVGGGISGFIMAVITCFVPRWSGVTAPMYALLKGLFLGGISALYNTFYDGIVFQAICLTFGTLFTLLTAYRTGMIKVTQKFRLGVVAATGGIMLTYVVMFFMRMFMGGVPDIFSNGIFGIGFSVVIVIVASLNLVLDFDAIDQGARYGAPKYVEWYCAFGLMVTLVWLYLEILRLLAILQAGDD
ncbi:MAG: hypothetical protein CMJ78_16270 [Planctomycetaceae bacterium]|nr:hypothetical protein [Planctomycetaceae bacterium]